MSEVIMEAVLQSLLSHPSLLSIEWADGRRSAFPALWLRDNCPEDREPTNHQRLIDVADLPEDPRIASAQAHGDGSLSIAWAGEGKTSRFSLEWLRRHDPESPGNERSGPEPRLWRLENAGELCWMDAAAFESDPGCLRWLTALRRHGIAFLRGVPSKRGHVLELAQRVGHVVETNYGRVFDVRSEPNPANLAYTDLGLGLHTDNPYRDPVPGFQMLHCLEPARVGGESVFADGFAVASDLAARDPGAFSTLTRTPVRFTFSSADAELAAERPLIEVDSGNRLAAIHYNNRSIAPIIMSPDRPGAPSGLVEFYRAYRRLAQLLRDASFHCVLKLEVGNLVLFDNRRVLHGRTRFSSDSGSRHLQGCYLSRDSVLSRFAVLERGHQEGQP